MSTTKNLLNLGMRGTKLFNLLTQAAQSRAAGGLHFLNKRDIISEAGELLNDLLNPKPDWLNDDFIAWGMGLIVDYMARPRNPANKNEI